MNRRWVLAVLLVVSACGGAAPAAPRPGMAVLVVHRGEVVVERAEGTANLRTGEAITPDTAFNLASDSKQFTAAAALILEERGALSADDPVGKWIPGLPAWGQTVTVAHLIHHTAGLPDYMELCDAGRLEPPTNADVVAVIARTQSLPRAPGTEFDYSNTGYALLAVVVEAAAGESLPVFLEREIFGPLAMTGTWIDRPDRATAPGRATGYGPGPGYAVEDFSDCNFIYGDGSVYTTLRDYAKWIAALRDGRLFDVERAFTPGGGAVDYAYGWSVEVNSGRRIISHGGSWLGFRSSVVHYPDADLWTVVFTNTRGTDVRAVARELATPYLD